MLRGLVRSSLKHRVVVVMVAGLLLALGLVAVRTAKYDVFPEFVPPMVVVQTEAPGLAPDEVEALITLPIEYALNGTVGLKTLRSNSIQGLSVITAIFDDRMNVLVARQVVGEKLAQVSGRLPRTARVPVMAPLTSSSGIILRIGMTGRTTGPRELRTLADWTIRPRLLGVPGVANVTIFGGEVRQYEVSVHPERLAAFDIGLNEVVAAVREANGLAGAGFLEDANQRLTLTAKASLDSVEQLGESVVAVRAHQPVRLRQLADVGLGSEPKYGDGSLGGEPAVLLAVYKQLGANTLEVTQAVEEVLEALRAALPGDVALRPDLFRQADLIERSLGNVNWALWQGSVLVIAVLVLFLANLRTALISLTAIPLSLLAAVAVLTACGQTINTLTLGGLAIAIGEVVDDAIIDVENIYRRLRENALAARPRPTLAVILKASLEVRNAVVFATLMVGLVFVPLLFLSGLAGKLFAPLGYAYVLSLLASLGVALTVTPAMSALLLGDRPLARDSSRLSGWLQRRYELFLQPTLDRPALVGLTALALLALALAAIPFLGGEFLPELDEGSYSIHMAGLPGTSLPESLRVGTQIQKELAALPAVRQVAQQVGRAELSEDIWGVHYSELQVDLEPAGGTDRETIRDQLHEVLAHFPGYYFSIKPFLTERIEEVISGTTAQVAIRISGPQWSELDRLGAGVAHVLRDVRGSRDVLVEQQTGVPELRFEARRDQCERYGLRPVPLLEALHTACQGTVVNEAYEGTRVVDVVVRLAPQTRNSLPTIRGMLIDTPAAGRIPLDQLVTFTATTGRSLIAHEGTSRRALVQCNVRGRDVSGFLKEVRQRLQREVPRPAEYVFEFGGEAQAAAAARRELLLLSAGALVGIVVLLYAALGSGRLVLLVLCNLPFALVGGIAMVVATGGWVSLGTLVGFVTLFGISMRNSVMLISHYQHLATDEVGVWDRATAVRGAAERLGPILMTAAVTGLGLLPIALGGATAGREIEQPMALVILGGLITSTVLNLAVLPTLAARFARFSTR